MIAEKTSIPDIIEWLDLGKLHVHAPTTVVLVCGGPFDITGVSPLSFRDAFLKITSNIPFNKIKFSIPEEADIYGPKRTYTNWMDFEADFAQICQMVMLFCESEGSIAELGGFAQIDEIARKLFVLVDEVNYKEKSYIMLGPIQAVQEKYPLASVYVINYEGLGVEHGKGFAGLDLSELKNRLAVEVPHNIEKLKDPRTFDKDRAGHKIKFITGMVQHFGALTIEEIEVILYSVGIEASRDDVGKYIDCAKFIGWVREDVRGSKTYYVSIENDVDAFDYPILKAKGAPTLNKAAWKAQVRAYWMKADPERFRSITAVGGAG